MKSFVLATSFLSAVTASSLAFSAPEPKDPKKQSPQGLYVDAVETYDMMQKDPSVILVDVRTPEEWQFVGYTKHAKVMLPWVMFDYSKMDATSKKLRYHPMPNKKWINDFEDKLEALDADSDNKYVIMCRSGATRAAPVAKALSQYGYENVYLMTDGFEGSKVKKGDKKGFRLVNGWKNSGADWTYKINADKVYFKKYGVEF